ncbi:hypothetical protein [Panacagrimonas sp.]|uniref:hypothetical protein n=1 Tax=Panacagrimonas sp. TaxID=2480088 RepID=UPI003B52E107
MRILELNDVGLRLYEGEQLLLESPGCAALDGRRLLTGRDAQARLRLDPRRAYDRYWYQLDASLPTPLGAARSAADLAHAQLLELGSALTEQPLVLAAPASFTPSQLGVLLGILQALQVRAVGLVDAAVAAASTLGTAPRSVHVDVQRHRVLLTWLDGDRDLTRTRLQELKPGLAALQDRCAAVVAEAFVRTARFDPLHSAATEQALYDRLPQWMAQLSGESQAVLELDAGTRTHRAGLTREALASTLSDRVAAIVDAVSGAIAGEPASILLSDRAAELPGLASQLPQAQRLDAGAVARGIAEHLALIETDSTELPWVTRLPRRALHAQSASGEHSLVPTHALLGYRALPLPADGRVQALSAWLPGAPGLLRGDGNALQIEDAGGSTVRLNGEALAGTRPLRAGDRLSHGGSELRLIVVARAD